MYYLPAVVQVATRRSWVINTTHCAQGRAARNQRSRLVLTPQFYHYTRITLVFAEELNVIQCRSHQDRWVCLRCFEFLHYVVDIAVVVPVDTVRCRDIAVSVAVIASSNERCFRSGRISTAYPYPIHRAVVPATCIDFRNQYFRVAFDVIAIIRKILAISTRLRVRQRYVQVVRTLHDRSYLIYYYEVQRSGVFVVAVVLCLHRQAVTTYWETQYHQAALATYRHLHGAVVRRVERRCTRDDAIARRIFARLDRYVYVRVRLAACCLTEVRYRKTEVVDQALVVDTNRCRAIRSARRNHYWLRRLRKAWLRIIRRFQHQVVQLMAYTRTPVEGSDYYQYLDTTVAYWELRYFLYVEAVVALQALHYCSGYAAVAGIVVQVTKILVFVVVTRTGSECFSKVGITISYRVGQRISEDILRLYRTKLVFVRILTLLQQVDQGSSRIALAYYGVELDWVWRVGGVTRYDTCCRSILRCLAAAVRVAAEASVNQHRTAEVDLLYYRGYVAAAIRSRERTHYFCPQAILDVVAGVVRQHVRSFQRRLAVAQRVVVASVQERRCARVVRVRCVRPALRIVVHIQNRRT